MFARLKWLLIPLALALVFTCFSVSCSCAQAEELPEGYKLIAENGRFSLYLKEETLALIVESKASGARLYSTVTDAAQTKDNASWKGFYQSGIVMEYLENVKSSPLQADFINTPSTVDCTVTDNGYHAKVTYTDLGISYEVDCSLDEHGITVSIPQDRITEENSEVYTTAAFYVYPFLGYSTPGLHEGYMIIPDGQGAIIGLEDHEGRFVSPFDAPVYGVKIGVNDQVYSKGAVQAEQVLAPVFGMVHTDDRIAFLGVIDEGDAAACIMAYPNGVRMKYDWTCAKYLYRMVYAQPAGPSSGTVSMRTEHARQMDIRQVFLLEDGESANYAGLACAWRDYLRDTGAFASADRRPFDIQLDFLGLEKENFVLGKQNVTMTSFREAGDMLDELSKEGVDHLSVTFRGWQGDGLSGSLPTDSADAAGVLGGGGALRDLIKKAEGLGYPFSLEADFLSLNTDTHPLLTYSALKKITSATFSRPTFGKVYDTLHYLTPGKTEQIALSTIQGFERAGIPGIALKGITSLMTDYYESDHYQDSSRMMDTYRKVASQAAEKLDVTLSASNAYLWPSAGTLKDMPIGCSDYTYVEREIPFMAIATSGEIPYYTEYVNFQANSRRFFLHLIEQGTRPCFLLTQQDPIELSDTNSNDIYSSEYGLYKDMIVSWYKELRAFHDLIGASAIVRHDTEGSATRVTWSDGTKVYLNFSEQPLSLDGVSLDGLAYKVVTEDGR